MVRSLILVFASQFLVFCSSGQAGKSSRGSVASKDALRDSSNQEDGEDGEEEVTAIPPTIISGQYLACTTISKEKDQKAVNISCHLEKNGKVSDVALLPSDLSVKDDSDNDMPFEMSTLSRGKYLLKVTQSKPSNIKITLKSIGGQKVLLNTRKEPGSLESTILREEIAAAKVVDDPIGNSENKESGPDTTSSGASSNSEDQSTADEQGAEQRATLNISSCNDLSVPGSWVTIPGDSTYGTSDFCVMKYEAKCSNADGMSCLNSETIPISTAENTPWVNISQQEAMAACASLGAGFHLITNDEWMTLASNVASVGENWSEGVPGSMQLKKGHSDNSPEAACPASTDDALNVVENDCVNKASDADSFVEQRTHKISNGLVIWDIAGNVWEWTSYFNPIEKAQPLGFAWMEYTDVVEVAEMPLSMLIPQIASDDNWNSAQAIGMYYPGVATSGGALRRGGRWENMSGAGVFASAVDHTNLSGSDGFGFRCTLTLSD